MKQRAKIQIVAASISLVALVPFLWKLSAPARLRREFQEQATAQLHSAKGLNGGSFAGIKVTLLRYHPNEDFYEIKYDVDWSPRNNIIVAVDHSSCNVNHFGKDFSGLCWISGGEMTNQAQTFTVSLHP